MDLKLGMGRRETRPSHPMMHIQVDSLCSSSRRSNWSKQAEVLSSSFHTHSSLPFPSFHPPPSSQNPSLSSFFSPSPSLLLSPSPQQPSAPAPPPKAAAA